MTNTHSHMVPDTPKPTTSLKNMTNLVKLELAMWTEISFNDNT